MTIGIAAYADNPVFSACCTKEGSRAGTGAAVMGNLKNIAFYVFTRAYDLALDS